MNDPILREGGTGEALEKWCRIVLIHRPKYLVSLQRLLVLSQPTWNIGLTVYPCGSSFRSSKTFWFSVQPINTFEHTNG